MEKPSQFAHGMHTVFELMKEDFPPVALCKAAPDLLEACWAALHDPHHDCLGENTRLALFRAIRKAEEGN